MSGTSSAALAFSDGVKGWGFVTRGLFLLSYIKSVSVTLWDQSRKTETFQFSHHNKAEFLQGFLNFQNSSTAYPKMYGWGLVTPRWLDAPPSSHGGWPYKGLRSCFLSTLHFVHFISLSCGKIILKESPQHKVADLSILRSRLSLFGATWSDRCLALAGPLRSLNPRTKVRPSALRFYLPLEDSAHVMRKEGCYCCCCS